MLYFITFKMFMNICQEKAFRYCIDMAVFAFILFMEKEISCQIVV